MNFVKKRSLLVQSSQFNLYTQNTSTCMIQQEKKLLYSRHEVAELVILI